MCIVSTANSKDVVEPYTHERALGTRALTAVTGRSGEWGVYAERLVSCLPPS